ncbi:TlpA family protein disulfide reductase [Candidatus Kaiserbacteria bacterium]|nr:TlpA family protein disulfide reductase [Candidatus Kaiserbacteria bacterium]
MYGMSRRQMTVTIAALGTAAFAAIIAASVAGMIPSPFASEKTGFSDEYSLVLKDLDGADVRLSTFKNDVLVAYVWASWCPYCADEIRHLAQLAETNEGRIRVVAINRGEPAAVAKSYLAQLDGVQGLVFLLDPEDAFFKQIGGYAMPETVFIRDRGEIVFHQRGPMKLDEVKTHLDELLKAR